MGKVIDVNFDFTTDSKGYWDGFWERDPILGKYGCDPDAKSDTLRRYQYLLYRRELPNGEFFDLQYDFKPYLIWKGMRFSSDSIIIGMRYKRYPVIEEVAKRPDFREWVETMLRRSYTIGGEMLFPVEGSINSARGFNNSTVSDRFDLTLYCIQSYYEGKETLGDYGLDKVLNSVRINSKFYDCFVDFKGYVDFFFLQDCVDRNYDTIFWLDHYGRPVDVDDYCLFMDRQMEFLNKRNKRIDRMMNH